MPETNLVFANLSLSQQPVGSRSLGQLKQRSSSAISSIGIDVLGSPNIDSENSDSRSRMGALRTWSTGYHNFEKAIDTDMLVVSPPNRSQKGE